MTKCPRLLTPLIATLVYLAQGFAAAQAAPQPAGGAHLQVRWELQEGGAAARLRLANRDDQPLPAQGWGIYFNCIECAAPGPLAGGLAVDHLGGSLYRLRPTANFGGLAAGQVLDVHYRAPYALAKRYKAPSGLYLAYDAAPEQAQAITDYQLLPLPATQDRALTPQELYRRNARADLLPAADTPPVFPTPLQLQAGQGSLKLDAAPAIGAGAGLESEAGLARSLLQQYWPAGATPSAAAAGPVLRLAVGAVAGQTSPEAYTLRVDAAGIAITGNSAAGVSRGLQTLRELLPLPSANGSAAPVTLPMLAVTDAPRFAYRGLMLDVSRNFQPKQTVLRLLELMARFKLNTFHFHLTDDEGWRLEIAGLPELTSIGAKRGHGADPDRQLPPAYGSGPSVADPHGSGYYTRADYLEILRYAAARHIEIIPEIEMPGHARAAVRAMEARYRRMKAAGQPEAEQYLLNDLEDRSEYNSAQDYRDNVMNPGRESTYAFIEQVVKQVAALHRKARVPLRTLHVGGDELPAGAWEKSPLSRSMMARHQLAARADLWDYFYGRVDHILRRQGLTTAGWEELGLRQHAPNPRFARRGFQLYVWNNVGDAADLGYRLANAGYDVVLAPATRLYLDMTHNQDPDEPGVTWAGQSELDAIFDFVPFGSGKTPLGADGRRHIRGLEAGLWTETVRDPALMDYLLMPRLLAVAERAWAADPAWATASDPAQADALHRAAWSGFVNALGQRVLPRLDLEAPPLGPVAYRIAPPGLLQEGAKIYANHALPGLTLRYTSDGSEPTAASLQVQGPITARGLVQVAAFDRNGRRGSISRIQNGN